MTPTLTTAKAPRVPMLVASASWPSETNAAGNYTAQAVLTLPGGVIRSEPVDFQIVDPLP